MTKAPIPQDAAKQGSASVTLGRLLIVDDDETFAGELRQDGERLGLTVDTVHSPADFEHKVHSCQPTIIAMDLVMPGADGLELLYECARARYSGHLILMTGGFELYLNMAEKMATTYGLRVTAKLPKPFRPKQFAYLLISLI
jgi:DNA-binding NtrC family response regulator